MLPQPLQHPRRPCHRSGPCTRHLVAARAVLLPRPLQHHHTPLSKQPTHTFLALHGQSCCRAHSNITRPHFRSGPSTRSSRSMGSGAPTPTAASPGATSQRHMHNVPSPYGQWCSRAQCSTARYLRAPALRSGPLTPPWAPGIGRFRYLASVKCPYRVADKASALRAGKAGARLNAHTELRTKRQRSAREAIHANRTIDSCRRARSRGFRQMRACCSTARSE